MLSTPETSMYTTYSKKSYAIPKKQIRSEERRVGKEC